MRILFISESLLTGDLVWRLKKEGNQVRLFVRDGSCNSCYLNLVEKIDSWEDGLKWVGKEGLIIFDDFGFADHQENLRVEGYNVCGTSKLAENTEVNREYGNKIFGEMGIVTVPLQSFKNIDDAIEFVKYNPNKWVLKYQNGHWFKPFAYIGDYSDGSDVIAILENYKKHEINHHEILTLQRRVEGIEIGVARYFNGENWIGPIEYNVEHTHLFAGNKGPIVNEMGTVMWYGENENERLYSETLKKMQPFLKEVGFKGDYDINCIVNEGGVFPLEATARFGAPAIHAQDSLNCSPWSDFLYAVATGTSTILKWKKEYSVVISVVTPPFPYQNQELGKSLVGLPVLLKEPYPEDLFEHIHFDEIASSDGTEKQLYISGTNGYAFYVTGTGITIGDARKQALAYLSYVYVPRMFYRDDIGVKFEREDFKKLKSWGYLSSASNKLKLSPWESTKLFLSRM